MANLGRLQALDPRSVWSHEAHDFTPWLLENADALAEALGIDLELTAAEHPVGGFALDLEAVSVLALSDHPGPSGHAVLTAKE